MYIESSQPEIISDAILSLKPEPGELVVIFLAEGDACNPEELVDCLEGSGIGFVGGIFPGLIVDGKLYENGCIIQKYPTISDLFRIEPLSSEKIVFPEGFMDVVNSVPGEGYTALVLLDGLASNISSFLYGLFNHLGNAVNYLGGGAGSLNSSDKPCLFSNNGIFSDAAFFVILNKRSGLGVRHGWKGEGGPLVATRTNGNIVNELNWEPAFGVYSSVIDTVYGETITRENFFDLAKGHPFGILKKGAEDVVRDPIVVEPDGSIRCVGEVPENTVLNVLRGVPGDLIKAAGKAASDSITGIKETEGNCLVFDCISRVLYLGDRVEEELSAVSGIIREKNRRTVPEGVFSIGEISSTGEGLLEFFNKTIVVGYLYD